MREAWHRTIMSEHFSTGNWVLEHTSPKVSEAYYDENGKNRVLVRLVRQAKGYSGEVIPSHDANHHGIQISRLVKCMWMSMGWSRSIMLTISLSLEMRPPVWLN